MNRLFTVPYFSARENELGERILVPCDNYLNLFKLRAPKGARIWVRELETGEKKNGGKGELYVFMKRSHK